VRRFRILNTAGEQVGEGIEWTDGTICEKRPAAPWWEDYADAAEFGRLNPEDRIDWLDPEPDNARRFADLSRSTVPSDLRLDGDGGVIGFAEVSYSEEIRPKLGRGAVERVPGTIRLDGPAPDPHAFQIRDGDPMMLEGVEGHVKLTERGLSFVPKGSR
jgi:hypothetical protein